MFTDTLYEDVDKSRIDFYFLEESAVTMTNQVCFGKPFEEEGDESIRQF